MVAPRPRLAVLLLVLGAPALAQGLGGLDGCSRWEGGGCSGSVRAGLADQAQKLQAGFASGLLGLQDRLVGLQSSAASGAQGLAAGLSSGTEGLRQKLAGLKGQLVQESEYWDRKARESWHDGLANLTSARQWLQEELSLRTGRLQEKFAQGQGTLTSALQLNLTFAQVQDNLTSAKQLLQEELSLMTERLQDRFARVQGNLTSALQLNLTFAQVQDSLTFARLQEGGLSSRLAGKLAWLKDRFGEESGYWDQRIREAWQAAPDSWRGEATHARRRAEEPEEEPETAREVARAREDAAQEARMARRFQAWLLEGDAVQARQVERPRGEVHAREGATEGPPAGIAQLCEERLAEERRAEHGHAVRSPSFVWGGLGCLCCIGMCLVTWRVLCLAGVWRHVTSRRRLTSLAQTTQDEFDGEFPSDVHDEAEADGTRRRILKIQCRGVQHEDISVESVCNGCAVTIAQRDPGGGPTRARSRLFQWQLSEGLFSLVDELAKFERGVLHLVLRESPPQGRAVRLAQHFRLDDDDVRSDFSRPNEGSEVSGDYPPSDVVSVDSWERVDVIPDRPPSCSDGEEGSPEGRPGAGPP